MTGKTCLDAGCHDDLTARKFIHAPAMQGDCDVCHELAAPAKGPGPTLHRFRTSSPTLSLCGECHKDLRREFKFEHDPFHKNCTECHDPHGGAVRYFIVGGSADDFCLRCHEDLLEDKEFLHAPVAFRSCHSCHTSHDSDFEGLLVRPPERLCVYCHIEFRKALDEAASVHEPVRDACFDCHDAHGGKTRGFLPTTQAELCKECHGPLYEQMAKARYSHQAMIEHKECSECHDPHWADAVKLLKRAPMAFCLECHTEAVETESGRRIAAVGEQIMNASFLHGPIEQQDCTACHAAHGNDDPRLMKDAFPTGFYADFSPGIYALCFGCHDPGLLEKDRPYATGFRNGSENLHAFHVRQEKKGRSCRACHHEHASNAPFHIRDWVPYGKWKMDIVFQPSRNGGTCIAGCHTARGYDRVQPVDNAVGEGGIRTVAQASRPAARPVPGTPAAGSGPSRGHLSPGAVAPDFTLTNLVDGSTVSLSRRVGPRLVVFVRAGGRFTSATVALCRRLPRQLPSIRGRLSPILVWVGPAPGAGMADAVRRLGRPWRALHDPEGEASRAFRVVVSPTIYLLDAGGRITHVFPGWQARLESTLLSTLVQALALPASAEYAGGATEMSPEDREALKARLAREMERRNGQDKAPSLRSASPSGTNPDTKEIAPGKREAAPESSGSPPTKPPASGKEDDRGR